MNNSIEQIGKLVDHGMNIMRINCSHGDHAHH
jgi:pyruvate kinase